MINSPPIAGKALDGGVFSPAWAAWFMQIFRVSSDVQNSGPTANRPAINLYAGKPYFDTTLGKPIWYEGPGWVDATGASV